MDDRLKDYNLTLVTPPATEPVSLTDIKSYLRLDDITDPTEDAYINVLISVAREYCEDTQHRAYITQTWEMALPGFPFYCSDPLNANVRGSIIEIPKGKLQTINSITYKDTNGVITTLTPEVDYVVSNRGIVGRVSPPFGKVFPLAILYPLDPVVINFTCGYGDDVSKVPYKVIQAMYMLISHWYENRMVINDLRGVVPSEITFAVTSLLMKDKITIV
jgi:uncharacterized phiE125 gp8 family phage protein